MGLVEDSILTSLAVLSVPIKTAMLTMPSRFCSFASFGYAVFFASSSMFTLGGFVLLEGGGMVGLPETVCANSIGIDARKNNGNITTNRENRLIKRK